MTVIIFLWIYGYSYYIKFSFCLFFTSRINPISHTAKFQHWVLPLLLKYHVASHGLVLKDNLAIPTVLFFASKILCADYKSMQNSSSRFRLLTKYCIVRKILYLAQVDKNWQAFNISFLQGIHETILWEIKCGFKFTLINNITVPIGYNKDMF